MPCALGRSTCSATRQFAAGRTAVVAWCCTAPPKAVHVSGCSPGASARWKSLGHGQQFVSHGVHPSGAPLDWYPDPPELTPLDTLPSVTEEQVTAFLAAVAPLIEAEEPKAEHHNGNGQDGPHFDGAANHNILDVIAALAVIPNRDPADWEGWNRVGMATWAAAEGSVHGFNAWAAWSSKHPQHDVAACRERWRHYPTSPPSQTGAGKLFRMAADAWPGWKRPSEGYTKEQGGPSPLWCDLDEWTEADIQRRPWIAPGYLLRRAVTLLIGPPSIMKSSLVLGQACALALGIDFGRFQPVAAGVTILYNVEDDATEQRRRLSAALRQIPLATPAQIREKVIRTGPSGIVLALVGQNLSGYVNEQALSLWNHLPSSFVPMHENELMDPVSRVPFSHGLRP